MLFEKPLNSNVYYVIRMIFFIIIAETFKLVITLLIDVVNYYVNFLVRWNAEILSFVDMREDSL